MRPGVFQKTGVENAFPPQHLFLFLAPNTAPSLKCLTPNRNTCPNPTSLFLFNSSRISSGSNTTFSALPALPLLANNTCQNSLPTCPQSLDP